MKLFDTDMHENIVTVLVVSEFCLFFLWVLVEKNSYVFVKKVNLC